MEFTELQPVPLGAVDWVRIEDYLEEDEPMTTMALPAEMTTANLNYREPLFETMEAWTRSPVQSEHRGSTSIMDRDEGQEQEDQVVASSSKSTGEEMKDLYYKTVTRVVRPIR